MNDITRQLRLAEHWWRMDAAGADDGADAQAWWHVDMAAGMIFWSGRTLRQVSSTTRTLALRKLPTVELLCSYLL